MCQDRRENASRAEATRPQRPFLKPDAVDINGFDPTARDIGRQNWPAGGPGWAVAAELPMRRLTSSQNREQAPAGCRNPFKQLGLRQNVSVGLRRPAVSEVFADGDTLWLEFW